MIFIPGNIPSLKNSKRWIPPKKLNNGKMSKGRLIMSKTVEKYLKTYEMLWPMHKTQFLNEIKNLSPPYHIGFHFIRDTRRRYDWINACQIVQDLMVKYNWITDDNIDYLFPHPFEIDGQFSSHNPKNPGVYVKIIKLFKE